VIVCGEFGLPFNSTFVSTNREAQAGHEPKIILVCRSSKAQALRMNASRGVARDAGGLESCRRLNHQFCSGDPLAAHSHRDWSS
jgi:hypothetical protein